MVFGSLLLLTGAVLLALQVFPGWAAGMRERISWPLVIAALGGLLLLGGMLSGAMHLAVPAFVLGGIGGVLYYQWLSGNWASWAYAWTLLPGFAGLGQVTRGIFTGSRQAVARGIRSILVSGVLFFILASIFGGFSGLGMYWPLLLVAIGALVLARALAGRR